MRIQQEFSRALDALIEQVKGDRSIVAAILCGSLSHDTVWAKSDIDLVLVTVDDKKLGPSDMALYADGVNVHAFLMPRAEFRKTVEGAVRNSFSHSMLAKGRLLYTHDETIAGLCARLDEVGERDTQLQLLAAATHALPPIDKAHKWFVTRGDLNYTALWILYAATSLARVEVIGARLLADFRQFRRIRVLSFATHRIEITLKAILRMNIDLFERLFGVCSQRAEDRPIQHNAGPRRPGQVD